MPTILYMPWIEMERGWGQRPDGCSLHNSPGDCAGFVLDYEKTLPDEAPAEYERPALSQPKVLLCSDGLAALVKLSGGSLRLGKSTYRIDDQAGSIEPTLPQLVEDARRAVADVESSEIAAAIPVPGAMGRKPGL